MIRKFRGWIETDNQGSKVDFTFDIDTEDLSPIPQVAADEIEQHAKDAAFDHIEWGYQEVVDRRKKS